MVVQLRILFLTIWIKNDYVYYNGVYYDDFFYDGVYWDINFCNLNAIIVISLQVYNLK